MGDLPKRPGLDRLFHFFVNLLAFLTFLLLSEVSRQDISLTLCVSHGVTASLTLSADCFAPLQFPLYFLAGQFKESDDSFETQRVSN